MENIQTPAQVIPLSPSTETISVTLDSVAHAIQGWRATKKGPTEHIPEALWNDIFSLIGKFPDSTLRGVLGISQLQFDRKFKERQQKDQGLFAGHPLKMETPLEFCEVQKKPPRLALAEAIQEEDPASLLSLKTMVVEFRRADGRVMKIHTTTDTFGELMKSFFEATD